MTITRTRVDPSSLEGTQQYLDTLTPMELVAYVHDLERQLADTQVQLFDLLGEDHEPRHALVEPATPPCPHNNKILFAGVGMGHCRDCGTNLPRSEFERFDKEALQIADILGVSIPLVPIPLNPSIAISTKNFFGGSEELPETN